MVDAAYPIMERALEETQDKLAHDKIDMPVAVSLYFAAEGDYDLLLCHLLKGGLDPNEYNINGGTALVGELCF